MVSQGFQQYIYTMSNPSHSSDSFLTYRNLVSRIYRLTMLIAAKRHEKAADAFDGFLEDLAQVVGTSSTAEIRAMDEFLVRDPPSPPRFPTPTKTAHIVPVHMIVHEMGDAVHVEKVEPTKTERELEEVDVGVEEMEAEEETEEAEEAEAEEETEEVEAEEETEEAEEETEETEETEEIEVEAEEETEKTEETEEVEVEAEEETEETEETEEVEAEEETEENEEVEQEEGRGERGTVGSPEETEETEETEEVEAEEETEEVEVEEETEEVEQEEGRGERGTVGSPEEVEAEEETEEGSYEPIKIGKTSYFLDTSTQNVFAFISDEEAGEYVGKLVNGKLVRA